MAKKRKKQCGGIGDYQWLIVLIFEAVVRVLTVLLDRDKPKEPEENPAGATTTSKQKESSDG